MQSQMRALIIALGNMDGKNKVEFAKQLYQSGVYETSLSSKVTCIIELAVTQKPINMSIFTEKSGPPAWKQLPTWYQVSENDCSIPPAVERLFAKQMNATTISIPS